MILRKIELVNFRNYRNQALDLSPLNNFLYGENAQGKSNLLEAVYLLSHLRSNRAPRMDDMVMDSENEAMVKGTVEDGTDTVTLKVVLGTTRKVEINGRRPDSSEKAKGILKCVMFTPDDLYLVKGGPANRRYFLDEAMEETGPLQAKLIRDYRHVIKQRNALLRRWEDSGEALQSQLEPWNEGLVRYGSELIVERRRMVREIGEFAAVAYRKVSGGEDAVSFDYMGSIEENGVQDEEVEVLVRKELKRRLVEERRARCTLVGPHRDDVEIRLKGRSARFAASQGEQRTLAFCMRVAQVKYVQQRTGKQPILLLDDVLSELDAGRRLGVLELASGERQALITATELSPEMVRLDGEAVKVSGGTVERS